MVILFSSTCGDEDDDILLSVAGGCGGDDKDVFLWGAGAGGKAFVPRPPTPKLGR